MEIFSLIKEEHQAIKKAFKQALGEGVPEFTSLQKVYDVVIPHLDLEEKVFYPSLKDKKETQSIIEEFYSEHREARQTLERLKNGQVEPEMIRETLEELFDEIDLHIKTEEDKLFPKVKEVLTKEELETMGKKAEAFKAEHQERLIRRK